jgi:hypothetical protein
VFVASRMVSCACVPSSVQVCPSALTTG